MQKVSKLLRDGILRFFRPRATAVLVVWVASSLAFAQFPTTGRRFGSQIDIPVQENAALGALSPEAQAVMQKLTDIEKFSVNDFIYRVGDAPDGASVDLIVKAFLAYRVDRDGAHTLSFRHASKHLR